MINEVRCIRCKNVLTSRAAVARGYGDDCKEILNRAIQEISHLYSREQIVKAATALQLSRVHWYSTGPDGTVYTVESGSTNEIYFTTVNTCTCPASGRCYHRCAVQVRELTPLQRH